jgi:hypothetical protein
MSSMVQTLKNIEENHPQIAQMCKPKGKPQVEPMMKRSKKIDNNKF